MLQCDVLILVGLYMTFLLIIVFRSGTNCTSSTPALGRSGVQEEMRPTQETHDGTRRI